MRCVVHRRPLPMDRVRANRHRRTGVGGDAYSNSIRTHALTVKHAQARTLMQARTCCNDRSALWRPNHPLHDVILRAEHRSLH